MLRDLMQSDPRWQEAILLPNQDPEAPDDRVGNYRIRWVRMGLSDACFESQSGFSTTGATVLADLEDPHLVPHCILFCAARRISSAGWALSYCSSRCWAAARRARR